MYTANKKSCILYGIIIVYKISCTMEAFGLIELQRAVKSKTCTCIEHLSEFQKIVQSEKTFVIVPLGRVILFTEL